MADFDNSSAPPEFKNPPNTAPPPYYPPQPQPQQMYQPMPQPQLGTTVVNNSTFVFTQPAPATTVTHVVTIQDNMNLAIFSFICCFMPLGLAAIVMSFQSRNAASRGDISGAQSTARTSRLLSIIGIVTGVLIYIVVISLVSSARTSSSSNYNN